MSIPDDDDTGEPGEVPSRSDLRLYRRAINQRWPIDDAMRSKVVDSLLEIVDKPGFTGGESPIVDNRTRVSAAKALIDADKINQEQEKRDQQIPDRVVHEHRFAELSDDELVRRAAGLFKGDAPPGA